MSIDLAWEALTQTSLSSTLVNLINKRLSTMGRPSFMGPVTITSFEFGTASPDIELVDIRDVYSDFLEDDDEEEQAVDTEDYSQDSQWAYRKGDKRTERPLRSLRYGENVTANVFNNIQPSMDFFKDKLKHSADLSQEELHRLFMPTPSAAGSVAPQYSTLKTSLNEGPKSPSDKTESSEPLLTERPNIQLHFRVTYESNMRLTLTTSLIVDFPSTSFMTLPMKISVTGFIFIGEVVVAYESRGQRLHLCIVDDLHPYGPKSNQSAVAYSDHALSDAGIPASQKPLSAGIRLLPSIFIESEVGQADKHVLKNGTRVERFIQDVIRKTLEEELIFPNYHTILLEG